MSELFKAVAEAVKKGERRTIIPLLKSLHHHIKATKPAACELPVELVTLLVAFLFSDDKKQWHAKHMSMKVLMDLLPQSLASLRLEGVELDEAVLPYLLPAVLIQARCDVELQHDAVTKIVRWLSKPGSSTPVQSLCLSALMNLMHDQPTLLNADAVNVVSSVLRAWLRDADRTQAAYKRLLRRSNTKHPPPPVTEMDGKPTTTDCFTVLNVGHHYTPSQLLNVHSFCVLRSWLIHTAPHHLSADTLPPSLLSRSHSYAHSMSMSLPRGSFLDDSMRERRDSEAREGEDGTTEGLERSERLEGLEISRTSKDGSDESSSSSLSSSSISSAHSSALASANSSMHGSVPGSGYASSLTLGTSQATSSLQSWIPGSVSHPSPLQNRRHLSSMSSPHGSSPHTPSPTPSGRTSPGGWSLASGRSLFPPAPDPSTPTAARLTDTAFYYCMRVLKQASIKPQHKSDIAVQDAALVEAVSVLDHLCRQNLASPQRVIEELVKQKERLHRNPRVLLAVIEFLLHNGDDVKRDWSTVYEKFFKSTLNTKYSDPAIAYDTMQFIVGNLETICYNTNILGRFFPNLFKILVWDCENFKDDFMWILPAILSPTTAIEVIHMVLDLPTITACLEVQYQHFHTPQSPLSPVFEVFHNPALKPLFLFLLRGEAGFGDTVDRLEKVYELLKGPVLNEYRVQKVAEMVPQLLQLIFDEILEESDMTVAAKLVPVLLERSTLLIGVPGYVHSINKLFCETFLRLFRAHPSLAVEEFTNLHDFLSNTSNLSKTSHDFFTTVVSVVGEQVSTRRSERVTPELVTAMYETLEPLCYELSARHRASNGGGAERMSPRLIKIGRAHV